MARRVQLFPLCCSEGDFRGQRFRIHHRRARQGLWLLRRILSHSRAPPLICCQLKGLPPAAHGRGGEMLGLRPVRDVLSRLRHFRGAPCTLTRAVSSRVSIFSTATTPAVREPSPQVRDLPQDIRSRRPPRLSSASPGASRPSAASSSKWRTSSRRRSPSPAPFGVARRPLQSPPDRASRS